MYHFKEEYDDKSNGRKLYISSKWKTMMMKLMWSWLKNIVESKIMKKHNNLKLNKFSYLGNYDVIFDQGLDPFCVDLSEIGFPREPRRKFRCWIEDWEFILVKKIYCVAKSDLSEKYKGVFLIYWHLSHL